MDEREVAARHLAAQRGFYRLFDGASPGARVIQRDDGVSYLVCPARPERSLVNAVLYDDARALAGALDDLAAIYDEAGIQAWTVWVHVGDEVAAAACAAHGHVLDATPELMWAPLDALRLDTGHVEIDEEPTWATVGALNDAAYGLPPDHLAVAMLGADPDACLRAVALDGRGRPCACAGAVTTDGLATVAFVATLPHARGRGMAAACIRSCLARARATEGATATVLEATKMGEALYATMGYRRLGALGMWEHRRGQTP